jgi:Ser/Thr protein kinase RdoA (MazF antagonist)
VFDDAVITLWTFVEHVCADQHDPRHVVAAAQSLIRVHAALGGLATPVPEFWPKMACIGEALGSETALPELGAEDRRFLQSVFHDLDRLIGGRRAGSVAIHGDAHLGNVFITAKGPRWNDFEDVCLGPREWDVSALPEAAEAAFTGLDPELLAALRCLRSLCVFFWCWPKREIAEERAAAEHHLALLRQSPLFGKRRAPGVATKLQTFASSTS